MLTFNTCSRRDFLHVGALGLGGLTLADLLRLRAQEPKKAAPKSVIMIYLEGGPSHIDMYDMKPAAPADFRGEFKPIQTNVPGTDISELMPLQAKIADKFSIMRGVKFDTGPAQPHSLRQIITGFPIGTKRPAFGSVVAKLGGPLQGLPPFVSLSQAGGDSLDSREDPAYLGAGYQPFTPGGLNNLSLTRGVALERLHERQALLQSFDTLRRDLDAKGHLTGMDHFTTQALDMIVSPRARDAFDLRKEALPVRERYGPASSLLMARRLVEAGVPVVSLIGPGRWDTHKDNFATLRKSLPELDHALHALITDLYERGLDQQVAVVVWGEFGRAPRVDTQAGRNHHADAGFVLMVGGGLKMGQVVGATDPRAVRSTSVPYTPQNLLATLYHILGIDSSATLPDHTGRPMYLLDERDLVRELV
ncbi:MAG: DUF1501 domain-containing protein [Planctomycetia bacterium]|nr:DUF1501 domain-containing protein [Planctomycetia bacterium]